MSPAPEGNSPVSGEFPTQRASNVGNIYIWLCHPDQIQKKHDSLWAYILWDVVFIHYSADHTSSVVYHDDIIKWKHFLCNWPFVWGIHRSPVDSTHKGQWRGALILSLIPLITQALWLNTVSISDTLVYNWFNQVLYCLLINPLVNGKWWDVISYWSALWYALVLQHQAISIYNVDSQ